MSGGCRQKVWIAKPFRQAAVVLPIGNGPSPRNSISWELARTAEGL